MQPAALKRASAFVDELFGGDVTPWIYVWLRVALAGIVLIRHSDWLSPWIELEHHRWVHGLDLGWSATKEPPLSSPLALGVALNEGATTALVWTRTLLALLLLFGVFPRLAALLLGLVSYTLMASDRFHYYHHLHLLYLAVLWLSLAPLGWRPSNQSRPLWPLQLLRAFVVGVYFASGVAKLQGEWLSGAALEDLHRFTLVSGSLFERLSHALGYGSIAKLVVATELGLALLLCLPRTRRVAVIVGLGFHAAIEASMDVSTFGAQMAVLLIAFWPGTVESSVLK